MKYKHFFGTLEVGEYKNGWRYDTWYPADGGKPIIERTLATGPDDKTDRWDRRKYDPACGACWLNIAHTIAHHEEDLRRKGILRVAPGVTL